MKRKLKIIYSIFMFIMLIGAIFSLVPIVRAASDNNEIEVKLSDYITSVGERETTQLVGGVTLYKQRIKSYYDGILNPSTPKYEFDSSTVQWVDLPASSEEVKMVVWSHGSDHEFKSSKTTLTAKDWEKKHPGWIVVAAVNGDFFNINSTYEPLGLNVQDGDVVRPFQHGPNGNYADCDGIIGWDKNNNFIEGFPTVSNQMTLQIRGENGVYTDEKVINAINHSTVANTGVTLLTIDSKVDTDCTGAVVYKGKYDLNRMSNQNQAFVKGTIIEKVENPTTIRAKLGEFYLASKDGSLDELIQTDTYVRCQYNLTGEWANLESAIRYYCILLQNGKHLFLENSLSSNKSDYGLAKNPRTVIGVKKDGSTVMMVSDGRGMDADYEEGLTYFQIAEMMRLAGCETVYQMDGGGSATLVVRNQQGNLEVINRPSDGSERAIGNAILMVMRDPGFDIEVKSNTRSSIAIKRVETEVSSLIEDIKLTVGDVTVNMNDEFTLIEGLRESTQYIVNIEYYIPDYRDPNKKIKGHYVLVTKTRNFIMPPSGIEIVEINKNQIVIEKADLQYSSWINNVIVNVSGVDYFMGSDSKLVIDGLLADTSYVVSIKYDVIEPGNPNVYKGTEDDQYITTLAFNLPTFPKFEITEKTENSVKLAYEYDDKDDVAIEVYVVAYNELNKEIARQKLPRKRGNVEFAGIDLTSSSCTFKMEVVYKEKEDDIFNSTYYSEPIVAEKIEKVEEPAKKGCGKSAAQLTVITMSVASLATLIIRKRK